MITWQQHSKMKKYTLLAGVLTNPPKRIGSHNAGWTFTLVSILKNYGYENIVIADDNTDWDFFDYIFITEGVNFRDGSWNIPGGVREPHKARLKKFIGNHHKCTFIDSVDQTPNYYQYALQRVPELAETYQETVTGELEYLSTWFDPHSEARGFHQGKMVLGDSHAISVYRPGYDIKRMDGKTLHGALKIGLENLLPANRNLEKLVIYFGNIDIRFHIGRKFDDRSPSDKINSLLKELEWQVRDLVVGGKVKEIEIVSPLPVEGEHRKIPKSGLYKGQKFFAKAEDRMLYVHVFTRKLKELFRDDDKIYIQDWSHLNVELDRLLDFDHMENGGSVHLSPKSYLYSKDFVKA